MQQLQIEDLREIMKPPAFEDDFRRVVQKENEIHIYMIGEITDPDDYIPELKGINEATANDTIYFHVNSPGGDLYTAISIVHALKRTPAKTVAICDNAASAGTIITMACDEVRITPLTEFMIHNVTSGIQGSTRENRKLVEHQTKFFTHLLKVTYIGFMTNEEIESLVDNDSTLWYFGDELIERFVKWSKHTGKKVLVY